jgi:hypothetical protein
MSLSSRVTTCLIALAVLSAVASVLRSLPLYARRVASRTLLGADLLLNEVTLWARACPTRCSHCRRALFSALDPPCSPHTRRALHSVRRATSAASRSHAYAMSRCRRSGTGAARHTPTVVAPSLKSHSSRH